MDFMTVPSSLLERMGAVEIPTFSMRREMTGPRWPHWMVARSCKRILLMRRPSIKVPFVLCISCSHQRSPSRKISTWKELTTGSVSCTSQEGSLPILKESRKAWRMSFSPALVVTTISNLYFKIESNEICTGIVRLEITGVACLRRDEVQVVRCFLQTTVKIASYACKVKLFCGKISAAGNDMAMPAADSEYATSLLSCLAA